MKQVLVIILLFLLVGCENSDTNLDWGTYDEKNYHVLYETDNYIIYEREEFIPTIVSLIQPFSDTCGVVAEHETNYLLYFNEELHHLREGIEENLYTGEELVGLGVEGIHCD